MFAELLFGLLDKFIYTPFGIKCAVRPIEYLLECIYYVIYLFGSFNYNLLVK